MNQLHNKIFGRKDNLSLFDNNDDLYKIIEPLNQNTKYIYLVYELLVNTRLINHLMTERHEFTYNSKHHHTFHNKQPDTNYLVIYSIYEEHKLIGVVDENLIITDKYDSGLAFENINQYFKYDYDFKNKNYYIELLVFRSGLVDIANIAIDEEDFQITKDVNYLKEEYLPTLIKQLEKSIGKKFNRMDEQNIEEQWNRIIDKINRIEGNLNFDNSKKYVLDIFEWLVEYVKQLTDMITQPLYKIDHLLKFEDFIVNWSLANIHEFTIVGNLHIDFIKPKYPQILKLIVKHNNNLQRYITFNDTNIKWKDGIIPTLTTYPDRVDIYEFFYDGITYYGKLVDSYI